LQKALDDELRPQIEPGDLANDFGTKVGFGFFHDVAIKPPDRCSDSWGIWIPSTP
jgi:hypothetical protein